MIKCTDCKNVARFTLDGRCNLCHRLHKQSSHSPDCYSPRGLDDYSDIELLKALIKRNGFQPASIKTQRHGEWHSAIVGIGKNESAEICLTDEAIKELDL